MRTLIAAAMILACSSAHAQETHPELLAPNILRCFHPTARFLSVEIVANQWDGAASLGADQSLVARIYFSGAFTHHPYAMDVALMLRAGMSRALVLTDTAVIPPSDDCPLRQWN